jgi:ATP/maltotriose-dependent transcriptional regulator MalT
MSVLSDGEKPWNINRGRLATIRAACERVRHDLSRGSIGEESVKAREDVPGRAEAELASELRRGREAWERRSFGEAFEALSAADRLAPLSGEDLDRLARAAALMGREEDFLRFLERAHHAHLEAGDDLAAARSAFWLGFRLLGAGELGRATGWMARAERLLDEGGHDGALRGYLLLPVIRRHVEARDYEAAVRTAAEAGRIGERFSDRDLVAFARNFEGQVLLRAERIPEGLALLDEAMVAVSSGELSPIVTGIIYCMVIRSCQDVYALGRAREWTEALEAWCEAQPGPVVFAGHCLVHRSEIHQWNGEWDAAREEARAAAERLLTGLNEREAAPAFYQQAELHRLRGELAEAEEAYANASRLGREPQPGLALLRLAQGRAEAAASAMRRVVETASGRMQRTRLLPAHVEIMLAAGDLEEARRAAGLLQDLAKELSMEVVDAMALHAVGAVRLAEGDARAALAPLRRSFETWQKLGAPYLAAKVRVLVARACRLLGDSDGCHLEIEGAREVFRELGAATDLAAVDAALAAAGTPETRPRGLTSRELQVLRLVATGKTNKAIAAELFLSEKTVDRHVSNIFDKLGVASRTAATAFAYENGLV